MNQEKIGKLIATLRKQKGLTQSELGAKVGVGFKAVSKWETGTTCPDISIINELSKVLGISSDELLAGEINSQTNSTIKRKKNFIIPIILISIIIIATILIIMNNHKSETYLLSSSNEEYHIEGEAIFKNNTITIIIDNITFIDEKFANLLIKNYEYTLSSNNIKIYIKGHIDESTIFDTPITILNFAKEFKIYYNNKLIINKKEIIAKNLDLSITFLDSNDNLITKIIKMKLIPKK